MRAQLISVKDSPSFVVRVTPGVRDHVDYDALAWIEQTESPLLAPLRVEERLGKVSALNYTFAGGASVRSWVSQPLQSGQFQYALTSLAEALKLCVDAHERLSIILDPEYVFADESGRLVFCCLPVQGRSLRRHTSLSGLLDVLCAPEVQVLGGVGAQVRERLASLMSEYEGSVDLGLLVFFLANTAGYPLPSSLLSVLEEEDGAGTSSTSPGGDDSLNPQTSMAVSWRGVHDRGSIDNYRRDRAGGMGGSSRGSDQSVAGRPPLSPEPRTVYRQPPTVEPKTDATPRPSMAPEARTYLLVRASTGEQFQLGEGEEVQLGRGSGCTVRIHQNPRISRLHATLRCEGDHLYLRDEGSSNGTCVPGHPGRIAPHETCVVPLGERFSLANEEFYVRRS